jgi:SOS-response transcriptional repressor LexA
LCWRPPEGAEKIISAVKQEVGDAAELQSKDGVELQGAALKRRGRRKIVRNQPRKSSIRQAARSSSSYSEGLMLQRKMTLESI